LHDDDDDDDDGLVWFGLVWFGLVWINEASECMVSYTDAYRILILASCLPNASTAQLPSPMIDPSSSLSAPI
jgi:hypothetical protein